MAVAGAAAGFAPEACAGIAGARMLVHADEKDAGIALETSLRSVAVVDVEIDDGDFLELVFLLEILGGDGDVGEEAEAHGMIGLGVMAGRPDGGKGAVHRAVHDGVAAVQDGAQGEQGDLEAGGRDGRVAFI